LYKFLFCFILPHFLDFVKRNFLHFELFLAKTKKSAFCLILCLTFYSPVTTIVKKTGRFLAFVFLGAQKKREKRTSLSIFLKD